MKGRPAGFGEGPVGGRGGVVLRRRRLPLLPDVLPVAGQIEITFTAGCFWIYHFFHLNPSLLIL